MAINYGTFVHLLFIGIIALFPVVNPVGSALIVSPFLGGMDYQERKRAVRKITLYAFIICTSALFAGRYILELFGLSIPVIQLAGGIMICKMGWESLTADKKSSEKETAGTEISANDGIDDKLFYPISFPLTTGAGTISVLFTLTAHSMGNDLKVYLVNTAAILLAIIFTCTLIYFFYINTEKVINYLGPNGETIVNRLSSFLIFCVGLQIATSGILALIKT